MSYDLRVGVKVEGYDKIVEIATPEISSPTYNLGTMFRKAMDWDFEQGKWYKCTEVLPHIERGMHELLFRSKLYEQYKNPNGYAGTQTAFESLESLFKCIRETDEWTVPMEYLWVSW